MAVIVLPPRQYRALCYLLQCDGEVLIDDLVGVVRDTKPLIRTAMRALVEKGLAKQIKFKGMVHSFHAPHMSRHVAYKATAKARRSQIEMADAVPRKEEPMPSKAPRHRTAASRNAAVEVALLQFVDLVEKAGGLTRNPKGALVPMAVVNWADLGEAYLDACKALDRKPKVEA